MKTYLFTSESVSEGHPDKVADQISDAILDEFLAHDPQSHVGCETLVTTGQVVLAGEVNSKAYVDLQDVTRKVIRSIGYNDSSLQFDADSCGVLSALHEQSADIDRGVSREEAADQGAGDQGMMFGYATDETDNFMPLPIELAHRILRELSAVRHQGTLMSYLCPDAKSQVTVEYDAATDEPLRVHTIVISTQHSDFIPATDGMTQEEADLRMARQIRADVASIILPRVKANLPERMAKLLDLDNIVLHVNPTGKFVIGGPHGDAGLTGRKIIVDTYGGRGAHGGGAFSGKDPSKVDRSAAYAARHIAKNLVAAGVCRQALVQVAYAIGVADPVSLYVDTRGTAKVPLTDAEISERVAALFPMRPAQIEERLGLRKPIYLETATYGHVGREPQKVVKHFESRYEPAKDIEVELFTWEKLDMVEPVRRAFGL